MDGRTVPNKVELIKQAQELFQAGMKIKDIAIALENTVTSVTIGRWLRDPEGNIAREERRLEENSKIHELRAQGLTLQQIADEVGVTKSRVHSQLRTPEKREAKAAYLRKYDSENREKKRKDREQRWAKAREEQLNDYRQARSLTGRRRIPQRLRERFVEKAMAMGVLEWTLADACLVSEAIERVLDDYPAYIALYNEIYPYAVTMCQQMRRKMRLAASSSSSNNDW